MEIFLFIGILYATPVRIDQAQHCAKFDCKTFSSYPLLFKLLKPNFSNSSPSLSLIYLFVENLCLIFFFVCRNRCHSAIKMKIIVQKTNMIIRLIEQIIISIWKSLLFAFKCKISTKKKWTFLQILDFCARPFSLWPPISKFNRL